MTPNERIYDRIRELVPGIDIRPGKIVQTTDLIVSWIKDGCDPDLDILPAINGAFAKMIGRPSSAAYFDKPVRQAHAARVGAADNEQKKADRIRWHRDRGITTTGIGHEQFAWLEAYDARRAAESACQST